MQHPQDCNSDLQHGFCGGGAHVVRFDKFQASKTLFLKVVSFGLLGCVACVLCKSSRLGKKPLLLSRLILALCALSCV